MRPDHYATLGVSPTSEDVVIHAAYRALIRHYHPDRNSSDEAAQRSLAINAAYSVLGDPERRADYDAWRREEAIPVPRRTPPGPIVAGSISAVAAGLLLYAILSPPVVPKESAGIAAPPPERAVEAGAPEPQPLKSISPPADMPDAPAPAADAKDLPELRSAVAQAVPAPVAKPSPAPERPAVRRTREHPPPQLATASPEIRPETSRQSPTASATKPSFDCRYASSQADRRICGSAHLALLDEKMAAFYSQSWAKADEARRSQLLQTRAGFVERRDRCRSSACLSDVYLRRMREISDIMGGQGSPR